MRKPAFLPGLGLLLGLLAALVGTALSLPTEASGLTPAPVFRTASDAPHPDPRWMELVRAAVPSGVRLQAVGPSLHVHLTDRTVAGRVPSPIPVSIRVTRGEVQVAAATATPVPDGESYLYAAALSWEPYPGGCGGPCGCGALEMGDVVWMTQGNTTLSLTVPSLTAYADSAAESVFGTAPPSATLSLHLYPRSDPATVLTRTAIAGPEGRYEATWDDVRPGDTGHAAWRVAPDRAAYVRFVAPLLQVQVGGWEIAGMAAPCSSLRITLTDAAGNLLPGHWASADAHGRFLVWPGEYEKDTSPPLLPGYRVQALAAGQVFSTAVLPLTARADRASGQVIGDSPPSAPVRVEVFRGPIEAPYDPIGGRWPYLTLAVTATAEGRYTATVLLAPADFGAAFAVGSDGHETFARFAVPRLQVVLGQEPIWYGFRLQGQVDGTAVPITVTLQGPAGALKDIRLLQTSGSGFFRDLGEDRDPVLESGDVLTVETPRGIQAALTLPPLTARVNTLSDTVSGEAPPGARLTLRIWGTAGYGPPAGQSFGPQGDGGPARPPIENRPPWTPGRRASTCVDASFRGSAFADPSAESPQWTTSVTPQNAADGVSVLGGGEPTPLPPPTIWVSQVITVGMDGTYVADLRGVVDLTPLSAGEVSLTTPEGHIVVRTFRGHDCRVVLTSVFVGGNYVGGLSGQGCPSATVRVVDPTGTVKAQAVADFTWWNWFGFYFYLNEACPWPGNWCGKNTTPIPVLPGDRIEVLRNGTLFTTPVPTLTLEATPETPALSGWGPPGEVLRGEIRDEAHELRYAFTTTVAPGGRYTVPLTGLYNPTAGDRITIWWTSGETNFYVYDRVPHLVAGLYGRYLYGSLHPLIPYTVAPGLATGYAGPDGGLGASVSLLLPGHTVTVTTPREVLTMTLPWLTARIDRAARAVSGEAPPSEPVEVSLNAFDFSASRRVTATAAGTYTIPFPEVASFTGAWGTVWHTDARGYRTFLRFGARAWFVTLGERCADGYADMADAPFTATLETADGSVENITGTTFGYNASFSVCFSRPVESGDRLTLTQASGETSFIVPRLTASHDWAAQILEGEAPPGSLVEVVFPWEGWTRISRRTMADASGRYRLDTRGLGLRLGETGLALLTDAEGNIVRRAFRVRGYPVYLPVVVRE
ncbi:MAG: hypothetical protein NZ769_07745 [Anaerolineae bacterium]|nr:hypothetical protein [Anaerolineae bacterium]